jgi:hypothetical protein
MTNKELIALLSQFPPEQEVKVDVDTFYWRYYDLFEIFDTINSIKRVENTIWIEGTM